MPKIKFDKFDLNRSRTHRRVLVLCLVLFAFYPLIDAALDAYSDHLTHPLRMTPDDRVCSSRHNGHSSQKAAAIHQISLPGMESPVCFSFGRRMIPADVKNAYQDRFPLS